jgi:hypothetical protein
MAYILTANSIPIGCIRRLVKFFVRTEPKRGRASQRKKYIQKRLSTPLNEPDSDVAFTGMWCANAFGVSAFLLAGSAICVPSAAQCINSTGLSALRIMDCVQLPNRTPRMRE